MTGGEERVAESPYSVKVLPVQPVPRKCTLIGPGRIHSTMGELAEFFIEGRDQFGNRCCLSCHTLLLHIAFVVLRGDSDATQNMLSVLDLLNRCNACLPLELIIWTMTSVCKINLVLHKTTCQKSAGGP